MRVLENQKPQDVFYYFEEISRIPRASYHTRAISDYLVQFAKTHGFEHYQDDDDNVIIIKEASPGYEASEPVILQGHMDMVCEKEAGREIDFETEGLTLFVDGDFVRAEGTTLGGDDGIALACALAVLDDDTLCHPRLEAVFTTNEEVGLLGAKSIDLSMLKGHILLNIDSDREGHFLTSCAGGLTAQVKIPVSYQKEKGRWAQIRLHGLLGGHSGSEIDKEHANAIVTMGRILKYLKDRMPYGVVSLEGGRKDNAIPREATAGILLPDEAEGAFSGYVEAIADILKKEYINTEPNLSVSVEIAEERECDVLSVVSMEKVLFYLRNAPNGVLYRSVNFEGLVETSLNAGILKLDGTDFCISTSVRSSVGSRKEELCERLTYLTEFLGGMITLSGDYPAWEYRDDSKVRALVSKIYREETGREPIFEAIHAGLECGALSDKIPGMDAVSFGPDNFDIHTPNERLSISSTARVYRFLVRLLAAMR